MTKTHATQLASAQHEAAHVSKLALGAELMSPPGRSTLGAAGLCAEQPLLGGGEPAGSSVCTAQAPPHEHDAHVTFSTSR